MTPKFREWLSPLVHLSNNWISLIGVVLVTTATIFWLFFLPASLGKELDNPYLGIIGFLIVPSAFFAGLALIPVGIFLTFRREHKRGSYPQNFPPLNLRNVELQRLLKFIVVTTAVNVVIGGHASYQAVTYMDSVEFCGQACHSVMEPEFTAYQDSPHSRVACVDCHIGPGAPWFVRSKLSGAWQVFAVTFDTYPRPIPTPVENLRPAAETCEQCHWPDVYGHDRLRLIDHYANDEANTHAQTALLMRIGGGVRPGPTIHGSHLAPGVVIRYAHRDTARQEIPWVEYTDPAGRTTEYLAPDADREEVKQLPVRVMDCMDCHNRPTHAFEMPERAVDEAISLGRISPALPYVKRQGVEIVKAEYASREEAAAGIPAALAQFYEQQYPNVYATRREEIAQAGEALLAVYSRNVFPHMRVTWGTYPNNIGHTEWPGCFRCHDQMHTSAEGETISMDCNSCHVVLAMEEQSPQILKDLGLVSNGPAR